MIPAVDLIVNPLSGPASSRLPRSQRLAFASRVLQASVGGDLRAIETRTPDEGAAAARRAVADGVRRVVVWGGDGTVNAVALALGGSSTCLGLVPGGSGNGFARALDVPLDVVSALRFAVEGECRAIDMGHANDRGFINIAGVGLDAAIAQRFNLGGGARRGLRTYARACASELGGRLPSRYRVTVDGQDWFDGVSDLVAVANGRQYGHGACLAPTARFDDGLLDVVVVPDISVKRVLQYGWRLFAGSLDRVPGVQMQRGRRIDVEVEPPDGCAVLAHRDGEIDAVTGPIRYTVRPRHLLVVGRLPAPAP